MAALRLLGFAVGLTAAPTRVVQARADDDNIAQPNLPAVSLGIAH